MICTNCNTEQSEDDRCGYCGSNLVIGTAHSGEEASMQRVVRELAETWERRLAEKSGVTRDALECGQTLQLRTCLDELRAEIAKGFAAARGYAAEGADREARCPLCRGEKRTDGAWGFNGQGACPKCEGTGRATATVPARPLPHIAAISDSPGEG